MDSTMIKKYNQIPLEEALFMLALGTKLYLNVFGLLWKAEEFEESGILKKMKLSRMDTDLVNFGITIEKNDYDIFNDAGYLDFNYPPIFMYWYKDIENVKKIEFYEESEYRIMENDNKEYLKGWINGVKNTLTTQKVGYVIEELTKRLSN